MADLTRSEAWELLTKYNKDLSPAARTDGRSIMK